MKILLINSVCGIRSTGRICTKIAEEYAKEGHEVKIAYGRENVPEKYKKYAIRIGTGLSVKYNAFKARIFDNEGFNATRATKEFLKWAEEFNPDILWLHNIHGYYINIKLLFTWIKSRPQMEVKWTLHDCWSFTGHCPHFEYAGCGKWISGCDKCTQKSDYPSSFFIDNSKSNWKKKKELFTGINKMTIITPSKWLAALVSKSYLKEYPIKVRYNTIDATVFKPVKSDFRIKNNLETKKIILGVSSVWNRKKGLDDFIKLSRLIKDNYQIVLVGLSQNQIEDLPEKILGISSTNSSNELAKIYSASDVFVNLTYEDNYPTVNLEANACGVPVITYRTGGSVESVHEENIVEQGDIAGIVNKIYQIIENLE